MVASYVGLLAKRYAGKLDAEADEYINFAVDGAKRMQVLIQDLLSYCRNGVDSFGVEPVKADNVVSDALKNLQASIQESRAEITMENLPNLCGDSVKLTMVFQNLLSNAIRFHKPDEPPKVRVSAHRDGRFWRFAVADQGIGFSPVYREKIFAIFQRLNRADEYGGTGIGLALCKRIVEGHGGRIWADSEPGRGSTFYFTLPGDWSAGCKERHRGAVWAQAQ
jgi:light-regulated signal transduction histidine kinase (bacteriophytochrome)